MFGLNFGVFGSLILSGDGRVVDPAVGVVGAAVHVQVGVGHVGVVILIRVLFLLKLNEKKDKLINKSPTFLCTKSDDRKFSIKIVQNNTLTHI